MRLAELSFPTMELYAMPSATQSLLDDSAVDIDQWIGDEVRNAFAEQEGTAFVNGDGVNKPSGFMRAPTVANRSWRWGRVGALKTGAAGDFPSSDAPDVLIDLVYALKSGYRANAHFVMNRSPSYAQFRINWSRKSTKGAIGARREPSICRAPLPLFISTRPSIMVRGARRRCCNAR
ncbi:MAG: phage major capsid protein [Hyphomicrobiaceae bacterium]